MTTRGIDKKVGLFPTKSRAFVPIKISPLFIDAVVFEVVVPNKGTKFTSIESTIFLFFKI
jgi:hypothetical protein